MSLVRLVLTFCVISVKHRACRIKRIPLERELLLCSRLQRSTKDQYMKHVFNTDEVAHVWAQKRQADGRNSQGNLYFRDSTLFSYRDSYPIARHVENKKGEHAVLIRLDTYSVTTARHIRMARQTSTQHVQFTVANVLNDASADLNIQDYAKRIEEAEAKTSRSRQNAAWRLDSLQKLINEANCYAVFVGIRHKFETCSDMSALKERVKNAAARHAVEIKKQAAKQKRDHANAMRAAQTTVEKWKQGEHVSVPFIVSATYLRIEDEEVVTSKGARFPVEHARLGLALVRRVKESGQEYQRNGHTLHLGHYAIDRITADGTVYAGCHTVGYAEIERIAPMLDAVATLPMVGGSL